MSNTDDKKNSDESSSSVNEQNPVSAESESIELSKELDTANSTHSDIDEALDSAKEETAVESEGSVGVDNDSNLQSGSDKQGFSVSGYVEETDVDPGSKPAGSKEDIKQINESQKPTKESEKALKTSPKKAKTRLLWFVVLILVCAISALFYGAWLAYKEIEQQKVSLSSQLTTLDSIVENSSRAFESQQKKNAELSQQLNAVTKRLRVAEDRLQAQNRRLLSLSTTTREDWLLAEVEYLLKLANQRVLIEKSAESAAALVQEADTILRDLDDPDLFAIREVLNRDLAALKLTRKIDLEGTYLSIQGLISQLDSLPIRPEAPSFEPLNPEDDSVEERTTEEEIRSSFQRFTQTLSGFFRIVDHSKEVEVILPPDSLLYIQQNLRLVLERSQLALLREQQDIYVSSLNQADEWLEKHYPVSEEAKALQAELLTLKSKNIVRQLPDISQSLELVKSHIESLHLLGEGSNTPAGAQR